MRKRNVTEYLNPSTLDDLRRIVADHEHYPGQTRIWIRHDEDDAVETYAILLSSLATSEA